MTDNQSQEQLKDLTPEELSALDAEELKKYAFARILEFITNNFYAKPNHPISILIDRKGKENNYWDGNSIVLSSQLMDAFAELNIPRFIVYYHELGHLLYSEGISNLEEKWMTNHSHDPKDPLSWNDKYKHLLNWIEDFYIEEQLLIDHKYLTDVIRCLTKLPVEYDIKRIEYAFNYWYVYKTPTPALTYIDQVTFKSYIFRLLTLRDYKSVPFGSGVISNLSIKPSNDTVFVKTIIEFYDWCVTKNIFPKDQTLPKLSTPNAHLEASGGQPNGQPGNQPSDQPGDQSSGLSSDQPSDQSNVQPADQSDNQANTQGGKTGSYSKHSNRVGNTTIKYVEKYHVKSATNILVNELVTENKLIDKELLDISQRLQADTFTVDGLFTTKFKKSAVIQNKIILPNFYNPNHLIDQVLFKKRKHTYMNVAIYRDISGSTTGDTHRLMHYVCEQLVKDIPVNITYYLYSSGDISIIEVPYIPWEDSSETPRPYRENPLYEQLGGGTNSDAIADVITQQLSDKWLNIIITDGDLTRLLERDNIEALMKNVFVVSVQADVEPGLQGIRINNRNDLSNLIPSLSSIKI